jgi:bacteriocin-like protein
MKTLNKTELTQINGGCDVAVNREPKSILDQIIDMLTK